MKKFKNLFLLVSFLIILTPFNYGIAWSNASYAFTSNNYDYEENYGTHDWIADAALNALLNLNQSKWSWLEQRKSIFLVGTEAPDNSAVNMTLDGALIEGFGDTTYHHIYFHENGSIAYNEDDAAIRAKSCGDLANARIDEEKLDQAAFYLGAMTHYISDMSMYAHVAENNIPPHNLDFDEHHSNIEGYVKTRTNEYDDKEEFFRIFDVNVGNKKPYNAAKDLAWNTYYDPNPSEPTVRNAVWLHNNFFSWSGITTYAQRIADSDITHQLYYDRIEQSLNNAMEACASAMNNVSTFVSDQPIDSIIDGFDIFFLIMISSLSIVAIYFIKIKKRKI